MCLLLSSPLWAKARSYEQRPFPLRYAAEIIINGALIQLYSCFSPVHEASAKTGQLFDKQPVVFQRQDLTFGKGLVNYFNDTSKYLSLN